MLFIAVLFFFLVYLVISVAIVTLAAKWAKRHKRSPWRWGGAAALGMYLLVFWDHIPTLILHKYYCATKAGFWVYKTPGQWKKENPGVAETLTWKELSDGYAKADGTHGFYLNERFIWESRKIQDFSWFPVVIHDDLIIDKKNNEVLAKKVSVGAGYGSMGVGGDWRAMKFWLSLEPCTAGEAEFINFKNAVKKQGEGK